MYDYPDYDDHENVTWFHDPATGMRGVIALHSTALGPAMGGCRLWTYPRPADALIDALRLSRGMSYKNAMAGLPLGGGKAVLLGPLDAGSRAEAFAAFGRQVEKLGGRYVTAEDVGVSVADMEAAARETRHVSGLARSAEIAGGDPSPYTARGVLRGMEAAAQVAFGTSDLAGRRIAVQGVGHVGGALCELLAEAGAVLIVADADAARCAILAERLGAQVASPEAIATADVDVLAPCALGGAITAEVARAMPARVIAGAANNQLATPDVADILMARGILYAPDYVINAGGIIAVGAEYLGARSRADVLADVDAIGPRTDELLARAAREGVPPAVMADRQAEERLRAAR